MASSFDKVINRMNTDSLKWDGMKERFGLIPDDTLPMWVADMDFLSPGPVIKALRERVEHGVFGYASDPRSVFDAVADWMERVHGWTVDPSWIFTAPGVMPAIGMAIRALTSTGDKVVIMPPVYPPFFRIVEDNERILVQVPLIEEKGYYNMDFEGLERACRDKAVKMVLLCSPHNPVGRVWTARELDKLAEISEETETVTSPTRPFGPPTKRPTRPQPRPTTTSSAWQPRKPLTNTATSGAERCFHTSKRTWNRP
ncbi:MAG: Hemolysin [Synergistales bacterium 53_16]|nr:MAG: Hemolysin [Synergistales bacterium 53_16]